MIKHELLPFFNIDEIFSLCKLCKEIYFVIESNKQGSESTSLHFTNIALAQGLFNNKNVGQKIQKFKLSRISSNLRSYPKLLTLSDIGEIHRQIRFVISKFEQKPIFDKYDTDDEIKQKVLYSAWSQFFEENQNRDQFVQNQSIFTIFEQKGNPLLYNLKKAISEKSQFNVKWVEQNLDNKIMGNFFLCRFEMLQIHKILNKKENFSHSTKRFKEKICGIGRIYKTYLSTQKIKSLYEGEIKNALPNGFGRLIDYDDYVQIGYFINGILTGKSIIIKQNKVAFEGIIHNHQEAKNRQNLVQNQDISKIELRHKCKISSFENNELMSDTMKISIMHEMIKKIKEGIVDDEEGDQDLAVRDEAQNIQQEQQENAEVPQWLRDIQDHGPSVSCVACGVVNNPHVRQECRIF